MFQNEIPINIDDGGGPAAAAAAAAAAPRNNNNNRSSPPYRPQQPPPPQNTARSRGRSRSPVRQFKGQDDGNNVGPIRMSGGNGGRAVLMGPSISEMALFGNSDNDDDDDDDDDQEDFHGPPSQVRAPASSSRGRNNKNNNNNNNNSRNVRSASPPPTMFYRNGSPDTNNNNILSSSHQAPISPSRGTTKSFMVHAISDIDLMVEPGGNRRKSPPTTTAKFVGSDNNNNKKKNGSHNNNLRVRSASPPATMFYGNIYGDNTHNNNNNNNNNNMNPMAAPVSPTRGTRTTKSLMVHAISDIDLMIEPNLGIERNKSDDSRSLGVMSEVSTSSAPPQPQPQRLRMEDQGDNNLVGLSHTNHGRATARSMNTRYISDRAVNIEPILVPAMMGHAFDFKSLPKPEPIGTRAHTTGSSCKYQQGTNNRYTPPKPGRSPVRSNKEDEARHVSPHRGGRPQNAVSFDQAPSSSSPAYRGPSLSSGTDRVEQAKLQSLQLGSGGNSNHGVQNNFSGGSNHSNQRRADRSPRRNPQGKEQQPPAPPRLATTAASTNPNLSLVGPKGALQKGPDGQLRFVVEPSLRPAVTGAGRLEDAQRFQEERAQHNTSPRRNRSTEEHILSSSSHHRTNRTPVRTRNVSPGPIPPQQQHSIGDDRANRSPRRPRISKEEEYDRTNNSRLCRDNNDSRHGSDYLPTARNVSPRRSPGSEPNNSRHGSDYLVASKDGSLHSSDHLAVARNVASMPPPSSAPMAPRNSGGATRLEQAKIESMAPGMHAVSLSSSSPDGAPNLAAARSAKSYQPERANRSPRRHHQHQHGNNNDNNNNNCAELYAADEKKTYARKSNNHSPPQNLAKGVDIDLSKKYSDIEQPPSPDPSDRALRPSRQTRTMLEEKDLVRRVEGRASRPSRNSNHGASKPTNGGDNNNDGSNRGSEPSDEEDPAPSTRTTQFPGALRMASNGEEYQKDSRYIDYATSGSIAGDDNDSVDENRSNNNGARRNRDNNGSGTNDDNESLGKGALVFGMPKKYVAFGSVGLLLIVVIVVVVVVLSGGKDEGGPITAVETDPPTVSPTPSPTGRTFSERFEAIYDLLGPAIAVDQTKLRDISSKQHWALRWITETDTAELDTRLDVSRQELIERYVMVLFFNETSDEDGNWKNNLNFLTNTSTCDWNDMLYDPNFPGVVCSEASRTITELKIRESTNGNSINKIILPTEIGLLTNLEKLLLPQNKLQGSIPTEIGKLTSLVELEFSSNGLTGTIPTEIGRLRNLIKLALPSNPLTGSLPTELGLLTMIDRLNLLNGRFSGFIPSEIGLLTNMRILDFSRNEFSGPIPVELMELRNLIRLFMYGNSLSGTLPAEIAKLESLLWMRLEENFITGMLPTELGLLQNVENLLLSDNRLTGEIPSEVGLLPGTLQELSLSGNSFTGTVPTELGSLTRLEVLLAHDNLLSGNLPESLFELVSLRHLSLYGNDMTGPLPFGGFQNHDSLMTIELQDNSFSGTIATEIGLFQSLTTVDLSGNGLEGTMPTELGLLSDTLITLNLNSNQLTGVIPTELGLLDMLQHLRLSVNSLSGDLPSEIGSMSSLKFLTIFVNPGIRGEVPTSFARLTSLERFELYGTSIVDGLEETLCEDPSPALQTITIGCGTIECSCCTSCI